ncbi:hypothetical protein Y032_0821g2532 [Ancylostoma ceylanicum]|uniref:Uncharacterized protein n=1 Tax=Ancylostoma ceylanicum TaxID=53326 RepID=A0A016WBE4_9BILA|nr:hypothetical protein Y032_0821g2532 [Ancylostoma ceylanicum]
MDLTAFRIFASLKLMTTLKKANSPKHHQHRIKIITISCTAPSKQSTIQQSTMPRFIESRTWRLLCVS